MGFGSISSKTVIGCLSVLFLAAALAMWIMGGYVISTYKKYDSLGSGYYTTIPAVVMIFVGIIFLLGTISGFCSATRENRCCKISFLFFILLTFILLFTAIIMASVYRSKINEKAQDEAEKAMEKYDNTTGVHNQIDYIQETFHCCGSKNYNSWANTTFGKQRPNHVPVSCCKNKTDCFDGDLSQMKDVKKYIYENGCIGKMQDFFDDNLYYLLSGAVAFLVLLLLGIVGSCVILWKRKDENYFNLGS